MQKDELLAFLKRCLAEEENAIPLYSKHLESTLFFSGFNPKEQERIRELLLLLRRESQFHARAYEGLIRSVKESVQNVY